ncbi:MAG: carbohydrate ABC transporter permease, partial [Vicinamibacterales bacterium]
MRGGPIRRVLLRAIFLALCVALFCYLLFPFYYAVLTSFESGSDLFTVSYWPTEFDLSAYRQVLTEQPFGRNILNSIIVSFAAVALSLALGVAAAFPLARLRFAGRRTLLLTILAVSMFPQVAVLSGLFEVIRILGLYNDLGALVFAYMIFTLPFSIWVLTVFMRDLPVEIEEAAIMD